MRKVFAPSAGLSQKEGFGYKHLFYSKHINVSNTSVRAEKNILLNICSLMKEEKKELCFQG